MGAAKRGPFNDVTTKAKSTAPDGRATATKRGAATMDAHGQGPYRPTRTASKAPSTILLAATVVVVLGLVIAPAGEALPGVMPRTEDAVVTAPDAERDQFFGTAVAVEDGTLAVSRLGWHPVTYLFERTEGGWAHVQTLNFSSDELTIDGDTLVAAASWRVVHVLTRGPSGWTPQATLTPPDPDDPGIFGREVGLEGDTLLGGAVHVYVRTGSSWSLETTLAPPDAEDGDGFGYAVAFDGATAVVGDPWRDFAGVGYTPSAGSVHIFDPADGWSHQQRIDPVAYRPFGFFGQAVAVEGDTLLIGERGAAWAFARSGGAWSQDGPLVPLAAAGETYGTPVHLVDGTATVGSKSLMFGSTYRPTGSIYVFEQPPDGSWEQRARLTGSVDPVSSHDLDGATVAAGVAGSNREGRNSGAVYVFDLVSTP